MASVAINKPGSIAAALNVGASIASAAKLLAADDLLTFSQWYAKTIPANYHLYPHIEFICGLIDKVISGEIKRLALSIPPGHGKSDTITRRLPLYWGPRHPKDAIVVTGYNQTFAEKNLSMPCRDLAQELNLLGDKATALDEWYFKNGSRLVARGVGSAPTGINPISLLIADDPIKDRAQANSEVERENIWNWWIGSIVQRFWPDTRAIIIATRWHNDDLIGRLKVQNTGEWTFVNIPAIADADDPLGRKEDEALWPEGKPRDFLEILKTSDPYEFESLFQGKPSPKDGTSFRVDRLQIVDVVPPLKKVARAWDIAHTKGKGDYTAGVKMASTADGRYIVLDVRRERLDTDERDALISSTAETDGREVRIRGPQDPGGKSWAKSFIRMLAGYSVHTELVSKAKETRWDAFSSQVNAGNVLMLRGTWNADFVEELRQAPNGKHDDQIDAATDAFEDVVTSIVPFAAMVADTTTTVTQAQFQPQTNRFNKPVEVNHKNGLFVAPHTR